jgi:glycosyltransferase involved in cell wall biosynthesis
LPARDAAATITSALLSVLRQTLGDWECVVADDGSADGTARIVDACAAGDRRVRRLALPRLGLVPALNAGLAACQGAFVARMDADDLMHRERLAAQLAALASDPSLAAVGCHVRLFPRAGLAPYRRDYETWLNGMRGADDVAREALVECPVAHPTWCARADALRGLGYRDAGWPEDYDLLLRLLRAGGRFGVIPRRLHGWRDGPARLSRTDPRYGLDRFTACKASHLVATLLAGAERYVLWGYGGTGRALRRALGALDRHPSHIVEVKRTRIGQRIHGAEVVPIEALARLRGHPIVVSVARAGPRAEIRAALVRLGFEELRDYVCAA